MLSILILGSIIDDVNTIHVVNNKLYWMRLRRFSRIVLTEVNSEDLWREFGKL